MAGNSENSTGTTHLISNLSEVLNSTGNDSSPKLPLGVVNEGNAWVNQVINILVPITVVFLMIGVGGKVDLKSLKQQLRRPVGVGICLVWQYGLLPLLGYGISNATITDKYMAIGYFALTTLPGGSMSNIVTYWFDGDVPLSITMTTVSTIAAFGTIPLNMFIYLRRWTDNTFHVPFLNITLSLVSIIIPVAVGMLIRAKRPKIAELILKVISVLGLLVIVFLLTIYIYAYHHIFAQPWAVWFAVLLLPMFSLSFGFLMTKIAGLPFGQQRSVAIECAAQNAALGIWISMMTLPLPYSIHATGIVIMFITVGMALLLSLLIVWKLYNTLQRQLGKQSEGNGNTVQANGANEDNVVDPDEAQPFQSPA